MTTHEIEAKIQQLPENVVSEVVDFIDFLIVKYRSQETDQNALTFEWEGGLQQLNADFTSVELQHKAREWR
jgi:hypothetical protein